MYTNFYISCYSGRKKKYRTRVKEKTMTIISEIQKLHMDVNNAVDVFITRLKVW